ncbi:hypothetical protein HII31_13757 [Pseudocercospora fuligena]|uniref:Uncharacterized protein n=1 Tax=Pseudocercospora fuligena TaxID=685502 RepID=A0A8H6VBB6_9PEZI|nr:hypothetical protein HII31_13757 [Pseudocercospora fuligena]
MKPFSQNEANVVSRALLEIVDRLPVEVKTRHRLGKLEVVLDGKDWEAIATQLSGREAIDVILHYHGTRAKTSPWLFKALKIPETSHAGTKRPRQESSDESSGPPTKRQDIKKASPKRRWLEQSTAPSSDGNSPAGRGEVSSREQTASGSTTPATQASSASSPARTQAMDSSQQTDSAIAGQLHGTFAKVECENSIAGEAQSDAKPADLNPDDLSRESLLEELKATQKQLKQQKAVVRNFMRKHYPSRKKAEKEAADLRKSNANLTMCIENLQQHVKDQDASFKARLTRREEESDELRKEIEAVKNKANDDKLSMQGTIARRDEAIAKLEKEIADNEVAMNKSKRLQKERDELRNKLSEEGWSDEEINNLKKSTESTSDATYGGNRESGIRFDQAAVDNACEKYGMSMISQEHSTNPETRKKFLKNAKAVFAHYGKPAPAALRGDTPTAPKR